MLREMATDHLSWLQQWYQKHVDGDWEHQHGIEIGTIDNPGWRVQIDLEGTELSAKPFERVEIEKTDSDWLHCWVEAHKFEIACGTLNLNEAFDIFRAWADGESL
jgi:hypothetical protein